MLGLVVPLTIFLAVYFATRRAHSPRKVQEEETPLLANNQQKLRVVIFTVIAALAASFGLAGVITWAIARTHAEWGREEDENPLEDKYRGTPGVLGGSVPHELLSDMQFRVYVGFIVWVTVLIAGLGLEIFVWYHFLQIWCRAREGLWRFAQFIFPLLLVTSLGLATHQEFWTLPILVVGLWKFGFPETLM